MSDTDYGSEAALLAVLPPRAAWLLEEIGAAGAAQGVSGQDLRDIVKTIFGAIGAPDYSTLLITSATAGQAIDTPFEKVVDWDTVGPQYGAVGSLTSDDITVDVDGVYWIGAAISSTTASAAIITYSVAVDGTEVGPQITRTHSNTDAGSNAIMHVASLTAGEAVSLSVKAAASETLTIQGGGLFVFRLGPVPA